MDEGACQFEGSTGSPASRQTLHCIDLAPSFCASSDTDSLSKMSRRV